VCIVEPDFITRLNDPTQRGLRLNEDLLSLTSYNKKLNELKTNSISHIHLCIGYH